MVGSGRAGRREAMGETCRKGCGCGCGEVGRGGSGETCRDAPAVPANFWGRAASSPKLPLARAPRRPPAAAGTGAAEAEATALATGTATAATSPRSCASAAGRPLERLATKAVRWRTGEALPSAAVRLTPADPWPAWPAPCDHGGAWLLVIGGEELLLLSLVIGLASVTADGTLGVRAS